jgi:transcriptional regulator with XRE-family HTH domain
MGHIERGEKNISFNSLAKVAGALGVPISELFADLEARGGETKATRQLAPRGNRGRQSGLDRDKLLKGLAALERGIRALREIAISPDIPKKPRG